MMKKAVVFVDMDNVLVDFQSGIDKQSDGVLKAYEGHYDDIPGIFSKMDPMPGAIEAMNELSASCEVYILSTAPWNNPSAWSDKLGWVKKYLGDDFKKRLILSHHKDLCKGDFIIDDRPYHGVASFNGVWIEFGSEKFPDWDSVIRYIHSWQHFYDRIKDKAKYYPKAKDVFPTEMQAFYKGKIDEVQLAWLKEVRKELEKEYLTDYPVAVEDEMRVAMKLMEDKPQSTPKQMAAWLIDPRPTDL